MKNKSIHLAVKCILHGFVGGKNKDRRIIEASITITNCGGTGSGTWDIECRSEWIRHYKNLHNNLEYEYGLYLPKRGVILTDGRMVQLNNLCQNNKKNVTMDAGSLCEYPSITNEIKIEISAIPTTIARHKCCLLSPSPIHHHYEYEKDCSPTPETAESSCEAELSDAMQCD